jgi:hypothetical protein
MARRLCREGIAFPEQVARAGIQDDRESPLFRPLTPDATQLIRRHLDRKTPWRLVKKYCRAAGIDPDRLGGRGIGIHSLRKTAINDAIRNGASMHEVREFAGHADIRTTELDFVRKKEDAEVAARRIQIRVMARRRVSLRRGTIRIQRRMRRFDRLDGDHCCQVFVTGDGRPTRMKNRANAWERCSR